MNPQNQISFKLKPQANQNTQFSYSYENSNKHYLSSNINQVNQNSNTINTTNHFNSHHNAHQHVYNINKQHNNLKDYEDQQDTINVKITDSQDVKLLKNKMKAVMLKLANTKKQKQALAKTNKTLSQEIMTLQNNLRQMVSGFANTSSDFPIPNQLASKISQFYKCQCLDKFFDLLSDQDLSNKGIIFFFSKSFQETQKIINFHFEPAFKSLQKVGCFNSLDGPVMNVLRKAFQNTYKDILQNIYNSGKLAKIGQQIITTLQLTNSDEVLKQIVQFLKKVSQILLCSMISDPPLNINFSQIGKKVLYNPLVHDPFDGFIKAKEDCWIILPQVRKSGQNNELVTKSLVLQVNYNGQDQQQINQ